MDLRNRLRNHPFGVDASFDFSLVLTYAVPADHLRPLLPRALALDEFGPVGFVAIAMVQTRGLRPSGFPTWLGRDFFLIGTRIFVRFHRHDGRRLRGLYILESRTNRPTMRILGNVFTHYNYRTTAVDVEREAQHLSVHSGAVEVVVEPGAVNHLTDDPGLLPAGSPFATWKDARRFAGPMPYTFSALTDQEVLVVEGVRQQWKPRPVKVLSARVPFFAERGLLGPVLASAFMVDNVAYHWKAGEVQRAWDGPP